MVDTLPTWQPSDSRRSGIGQPIVAWALCGVLAGTGGIITSAAHIPHLFGTGSAVPANPRVTPLAPAQGISVELQLIREALRLSVAETAQLLRVTRPTIYNWQNGRQISLEHAQRLREIALALEPHMQVIQGQGGRVARRAIDGRITLLEKLAQGTNAREAIDRLASVLGQEAAQRDRLARHLRGRSGDRGSADIDALG